jgi:hypothetical protein
VDKRIAKLPKWVQEHINTLECRAKKAELTLKEYVDDQTLSKISYDNSINEPETKYVQTDKITVDHADVVLDINLHDDDRIRLSWRPSGKWHQSGDICFIPSSYQQARLVNPKNASL